MELQPVRRYEPELFQHEDDRNLISKVLEQAVVGKLIDWIRNERIEDAYQYAYRTSFPELNDQTAPEIFRLLCRACAMFGLDQPPKLYLTRDPEKTVELCGFAQPFLLLSDSYLRRLDETMLFGVLASQAAGIRVGHHKGLMLAWVLDVGIQALPVPAAAVGVVSALLNNWKRCRVYTCDRAFLLAVGDLSLALRGILTHVCPPSVLDCLCLGGGQDAYRPQVEAFLEHSNLDGLIDQANSMLSDTAWLPKRYHELESFYQQNREAVGV